MLLSGCSYYSAKQPYRAADGAQMLIFADMPNGNLKISINEVTVINDSILNQDKSVSGVFSHEYVNVYTSTYDGKKVLVRCKFPDRVCNVFIDGDYAANLSLK